MLRAGRSVLPFREKLKNLNYEVTNDTSGEKLVKEKEKQNNPETSGGNHRGCWKEAGTQMKKNILFCEKTVMMAGFLILLGSYLFLNLARYTAQMDSDIAAEGLNARAIWEHHALIPSQFYPST